MKPIDQALNDALAAAGIAGTVDVSEVTCVLVNDDGTQVLLHVDLSDTPVSPPPPPPPPVSPPPPPPPPPTTSALADVPSVTADGQSILYHYPMDTTLADAVAYTTIPGTFGGSPTTVPNIAWNFGDGTNGFGADGRHPYAAAGTYTITGSVSYKDGHIVPFGPLKAVVP